MDAIFQTRMLVDQGQLAGHLPHQINQMNLRNWRLIAKAQLSS
jgi:hypothetical protein